MNFNYHSIQNYLYNKFTFISAFILITFLFIAAQYSYSQIQSKNFWNKVEEASINERGRRYIIPNHYSTLKLNIELLRNNLSLIQNENDVVKNNMPAFTIDLPMPDGTFMDFYIMEASIIETELAKKFPEIKTYRGQGIKDKTAAIRFDITPAGFHAMVISASGNWFIDPYNFETTEFYISYWKRDLTFDESREFIEEGPLGADSETAREVNQLVSNGVERPSGNELRTYRIAVATTGEYTTFHGGTVSAGLAAVVTAMNRINLIYENEAAVRMVLVADNDSIIYTNAGTDPYTNNSGGAMLGENQTTIDNVIGNTNYDIGHVFSTGGGGIASLGVPCRTGLKARGVTGLSNPIGDPFYIDYVAHEIGHQFGANHSFNGNAGSCAGGNRNASTAYEPGSGSTIMAYAGICGSHNLQNLSNDYFHGINIDEIIAYTTLSSGNSCPVITQTGNTAPVVNAGAGGFTIPINTAFELTGNAADIDDDSLTYCWEQFDLGPAGSPNTPAGNAPIFRTFLPVSSPSRIFPKALNLLNNTQTIGELLPAYTRTLTFRLTARDNKSGGGGVGKSTISFNVTADAGPFTIISPDSNISWVKNREQTITWNVANTDTLPVNTALVNILLSTDGGNNFSTVLITKTANDGSEDIILPNITSSSARIKIEAVGNIFFDISNTNFTIVDEPVPVELTSFAADANERGVELKWITATETNNKGFEIFKKKSGDRSREAGWDLIGFVLGSGTTTDQKHYSFVDGNAKAGIYNYRLKQIDLNGSFSYSNIVEVELTLPEFYSLEQNYPNPFNPTTVIKFRIANLGFVNLRIYDILGNEIALLVNEEKPAGEYEVKFDSKNISSGIYYYKLSSKGVDGSSFSSTKKMLMIK